MPYLVRRKNNAITTLSGELAAAATSCAVTSAALLPTAPFIATIWDRASYPNPGDDSGMEIVYCSAVSANTLTIVRAQEGTADVLHASGESIAALGTAGIYADQRDASVRWAKAALVDRIHGLVTATSNIKALWVFDPVSGTAVSDLALDSGHTAHNLTLSADASGLVPRWDGMAGTLRIGATAYFTAADHADFSFAEGGAQPAFSLVLLVNPTTFANKYLLAKYSALTGSTGYEWRFMVTSDSYLQFMCRQNSNGAYIGRNYAASIAGDLGSWHTYIATKSDGITSAAVNLYRDGVNVDDADVQSGTYAAMEDTASVVASGFTAAGDYIDGIPTVRYGLAMIVAEELAQTQITRLDRLARSWVGVAA